MNDRRFNPTIGVKRAAAAGLAIIVLMGGAAWHRRQHRLHLPPHQRRQPSRGRYQANGILMRTW